MHHRNTLVVVVLVMLILVSAIPAMAQEQPAPDSVGSTVYLPAISNGEPEVYRELANTIYVWDTYADYICFDWHPGCSSRKWDPGTWVTSKDHYIFFGTWVKFGWDVKLFGQQDMNDWDFTPDEPQYR